MPLLTVVHSEGKGGTGQGGRADRVCKWMEVKEDEERRKTQQSSQQTPAVDQPQHTGWSQTLKTLRPWKGCSSVAPVVVVWSVCQVEAPLHPSLLLLDVCGRLLLVCLLWILLGGCVHALKCCLRHGGEPPLRIQQEVVMEHRNDQYLCMSPPGSPGPDTALALTLADSLLLCVLQEPLPDPGVPHIQARLSRLESVSHTLEKADIRSELHQDSILADKVKIIRTYLQQRMRSLRRLVQVQGDFEANVKDMLEGLGGLWAQLEELHTGVTLTKEGSPGDLASAQTDAKEQNAMLQGSPEGQHTATAGEFLLMYKKEILFECFLLSSLRNVLCPVLQELAWSHTHIRNSVSSHSKSVWPELLLQTNIEQFDKVLEGFLSLEQQTSTFQAHLEGLSKESQEGHVGPLADGAHSRSVSPQTSLQLHSDTERRNSTSASTSVSSMDVDTETEMDGPLTLFERSALKFSSTIRRLCKSGKRK
ncbi:hypothetical protein F7725_020446 [Dissostichus mawsoni]|uniref:Uncharacterized protein n=1 Tax=Dissostichus mawsoni TaxID=36200 RepID=A0A7J5YGM2_DISMA|nr:hypothetical protein F7725_020446 [Dissostichus mawsoni]